MLSQLIAWCRNFLMRLWWDKYQGKWTLTPQMEDQIQPGWLYKVERSLWRMDETSKEGEKQRTTIVTLKQVWFVSGTNSEEYNTKQSKIKIDEFPYFILTPKYLSFHFKLTHLNMGNKGYLTSHLYKFLVWGKKQIWLIFPRHKIN